MLPCAASIEINPVNSPIKFVGDKEMSKATVEKYRPVVEATVVSLVLVAAALAVPAAILYASV